MKSQVFTIIPSSSGPFWMLAGIALFLVLLVAVFAWFAYSSRHVRFEVSPDGLSITGDMYGRKIPAASLVVDGVKVLDLHKNREYKLKWRTNGAGLPGYNAGWFKLANGEKSLCFLTNQCNVVYIPTTDGYSVMMSVARPEEFKTALMTVGR